MTTFLDLPLEIRLMVYGYAFGGAKVRFVRGLQSGTVALKRASSAALLVSSKAIYLEARPVFLHKARIDPGLIIDRKSGAIQCTESKTPGVAIGDSIIEPNLIRHIKISHQCILATDGGKAFVKSLKNLQSLTYLCSRPYFIYDEECCEGCDECLEVCDCGECESPCADGMLLDSIKDEVNDYHYKITGQCCDPSADPYAMNGSEECCGEAPIRGLVAAWAWRDKPFQLIAEVKFEGCCGPLDFIGTIDLDTKIMKVGKPWWLPKAWKSFEVKDLDCY